VRSGAPDPALPHRPGWAVDRWAAEAAILLDAEGGRSKGRVTVRVGARDRLLLELVAPGDALGSPDLRITAAPVGGGTSALPVLPDAATWVLPDLELLRAGAIGADRLHPLVASALAPDHRAGGPVGTPDRAGQPRLVECRGARHGVVLPSLRRRPPSVAVVIDTSGSVSDTELGSALLEVAAISRAVGGRRDLVSVVPCDAAAKVVHSLCQAEGIPLLGGGGTDLRTGFAKALRAQPRPDVIVVLTDGQTPWPDSKPPCRTVVGLFPRQRTDGWDEDDPDYKPDTPPAWARVVTIGSAPP
jgi:hypothetical protein